MTLAELYEFGQSRIRQEWEYASMIAACAINSNPYLKSPVSPQELNPMLERSPVQKVSLEQVAKILDSGKSPQLHN